MGFKKGSYYNLQELAHATSEVSEQVEQSSEDLRPLPIQENNQDAQHQVLKSTYRSEVSFEGKSPRLIIVSHVLPIKKISNDDQIPRFQIDEDQLLVQGFLYNEYKDKGYDVYFVGIPPVEIEDDLQDDITEMLMEELHCCPIFIDSETRANFYTGCCKQILWPLLHYVLPYSPYSLGRFNNEMWQAYVKANLEFRTRLTDVITNVATDYVCLHDYHLLCLPSLLRKRYPKIRLHFFLHSPFPSSEIFRVFPKREEIIRSLLNADVIGFHTWDYARHFLSCCSRIFGIDYVAKKGTVSVEYYGRNIAVRWKPIGVAPQRYLKEFDNDVTLSLVRDLRKKYKGKQVFIGIDDLDPYKGIDLKIQAFEKVLQLHEDLRDQIILVQLINQRALSQETKDLKKYITESADRINRQYSPFNQNSDANPIQIIFGQFTFNQKAAYFHVSQCCLVTCVRDGMNIVPYEYVICRQAQIPNDQDSYQDEMQQFSPKSIYAPRRQSLDLGPINNSSGKQSSILIVSEFVGCSPSLSGAIRVNPYSKEDVADAIYDAFRQPVAERESRHKSHWTYISKHHIGYWGQFIFNDLKNYTEYLSQLKAYPLGLGLDTFRIIAMDKHFRKLDPQELYKAYKSTYKRLVLLDYDGTLQVSHKNIENSPSKEAIKVLKALCSDQRNTVYLISGRIMEDLEGWFSGIDNLGIAAEHGFFIKDPKSKEIKNMGEQFSSLEAIDEWKNLIMHIVDFYVDSTEGSYLEVKRSALVWNYARTDPYLGQLQAKELYEHLESTLLNLPVEVAMGKSIVEVKPRGVNKGAVAKMVVRDNPDFIFCVGDDRSDEDMFKEILEYKNASNQTFVCTVGQKPSMANFYINDSQEVIRTLSKLVY